MTLKVNLCPFKENACFPCTIILKLNHLQKKILILEAVRERGESSELPKYRITLDISTQLRRKWGAFWPLREQLHKLDIKGVACDSKPMHFLSNSVNISSRSASFPFCVCAEKKSGTQPWLCKGETNRVTRAEPPTQDVKYRPFSHVSTKQLSIVCHNS